MYFVDQRASVRRLVPDVTEFPRIAAGGALHGATFKPGPIAPGTILTLFGGNFGVPGIALARAVNGQLATEAGQTYVLFDRVPARMLYASPQQVGVIAPYSLEPGKTSTVVVATNEAESQPVQFEVVAARPGLFTADGSGAGAGAILNQDSSINSPSNPAAPGSIVVLYGTGQGQTIPPGIDGGIASGDRLPKPALSVAVTICGREADVLYAGAAFGLVTSVIQVNVRVPESCAGQPGATVVWKVGSFASPPVTVAVQ